MSEEQPVEILLIKVSADPEVDTTFSVLDLPSAKGVITGFAMGGSRIEIINGGYRINHPNGGFWDLVDRRVVDFEWRHGNA